MEARLSMLGATSRGQGNCDWGDSAVPPLPVGCPQDSPSTMLPRLPEEEGVEGRSVEARRHEQRYDGEGDFLALGAGEEPERPSERDISHIADEEQDRRVEVAVIWLVKGQEGNLAWSSSCTLAQARLFWLRRRLKPVFQLLMLCYLGLAFVEQPTWCLGDSIPCASQRTGVYHTPLPILSSAVANAIDIILLSCIMARSALRRLSLGKGFTWSGWSVLLINLYAIAFTDCLVGFFLPGGIIPVGQFRISRPLRPIIFLVASKNLRRTFSHIVGASISILNILVSLALFVLLFVWLGFVVFGGSGSAEGREQFSSVYKALASMWILYTTANSPDVWINAYTENRSSFLFFFFYLVVVLYVLNNVLLAAVYSAYRERVQKYVEAGITRKEVAEENAFLLLKNCNERITEAMCAKFMIRFSRAMRITGVQPSVEEPTYLRTREMFQSLDLDGDGGLDFHEFKCMLGALQTVSSRLAIWQPRKPLQQSTGRFHWLVKSVKDGFRVAGWTISWEGAVDVAIAADISIVMVHSVMEHWQEVGSWDRGCRTLDIFDIVSIGFASFYAFEAVIRTWVFGLKGMWRRRAILFRADLLLVAGLLVLTIARMIPDHRVVWVYRACRVLHILRALRLMRYIPPLRVLVHLMVKLMPTYGRLSLILVIVFYVYATLGLQLFGGMVRQGVKGLEGTDYAKNGYWPLNFNDFSSAIVTLFTLMVVNNWFIIADAFNRLSRTYCSQIFFISFFVIVNLIVLNILVAFIIECCETMKAETEDMSRASDIDARQYRREEVLLRMFRSEQLSQPVQNGRISTGIPSPTTSPFAARPPPTSLSSSPQAGFLQ